MRCAGSTAAFTKLSDRPLVQDLQVGKTVHTGVSPELRTELWMSVLLRKGIGSEASKSYKKHLAKVHAHEHWDVHSVTAPAADSCPVQPVPQQVLEDIEKDLARTFPGVPK